MLVASNPNSVNPFLVLPVSILVLILVSFSSSLSLRPGAEPHRAGPGRLIPAQRATGLVFGNTRFEEVFLLLQIQHLGHPRERVAGTAVLFRQADL